METVSNVIVLAKHVDELGHMNHVAAVEILQNARDDWYQKAGLWDGRPFSADENLGTLVLNIKVNYRLECFLGEQIRVITRPISRGSKSYLLAQEILKADGSVAIEASVTSLVMDLSARETQSVPQSMARYLPPRD